MWQLRVARLQVVTEASCPCHAVVISLLYDGAWENKAMSIGKKIGMASIAAAAFLPACKNPSSPGSPQKPKPTTGYVETVAEDTNIYKIPFAAFLGEVTKRNQIVFLADNNHFEANLRNAAKSPACVAEAAKNGVKYFLLEEYAAKEFSGMYAAYKKDDLFSFFVKSGKLEVRDGDNIRPATMADKEQLAVGHMSEDELLQTILGNITSSVSSQGSAEADFAFFKALKDNNMELLSMERGLDEPLPCEKKHPDLAAARWEYDKLRGDGLQKRSLYRDAAQFYKDKEQTLGPGFRQKFDAFVKIWGTELDQRDVAKFSAIAKRIGDKKMIVVWGADHLLEPDNRIDSAFDKLGLKNVTISLKAQVSLGVEKHPPDYVYDVAEEKGMKIDVEAMQKEIDASKRKEAAADQFTMPDPVMKTLQKKTASINY
jgi:hypothetical protein